MSEGVWIKSEPSVDGSTYVVTLEADADTAVVLDRERATLYALGVLDAAHRAAYDAAVLRQVTETLGLDAMVAGQLVGDLRHKRPPLPHEPTAPLALVPGVAARDGNGFLTVEVNGKPVGQWSVNDARKHALGVLEAVVASDLDSAYYRVLVDLIGLDEARAHNVVGDIGAHREATP